MYTLRNEGTFYVITSEGDGGRLFFTGLYHGGSVPQVTDNPLDAAQFDDASEADDWITRPGYRAGLRVKRFKFELLPDVNPKTQMPWTDGLGGVGGRPIGTMVMNAKEVV